MYCQSSRLQLYLFTETIVHGSTPLSLSLSLSLSCDSYHYPSPHLVRFLHLLLAFRHDVIHLRHRAETKTEKHYHHNKYCTLEVVQRSYSLFLLMIHNTTTTKHTSTALLCCHLFTPFPPLAPLLSSPLLSSLLVRLARTPDHGDNRQPSCRRYEHEALRCLAQFLGKYRYFQRKSKGEMEGKYELLHTHKIFISWLNFRSISCDYPK